MRDALQQFQLQLDGPFPGSIDPEHTMRGSIEHTVHVRGIIILVVHVSPSLQEKDLLVGELLWGAGA